MHSTSLILKGRSSSCCQLLYKSMTVLVNKFLFEKEIALYFSGYFRRAVYSFAGLLESIWLAVLKRLVAEGKM